MLQDIQRVRDLGADSVVIGVLHRDGSVDEERTAELIAAARPMKITFNRAFDVSADLHRSLDQISTGADRILTSGGHRSGLRGAACIAQLVEQAGSRITILGGGGIRPSNIREFVEATGVREVHTSLRSENPGVARRPGKQIEAILGPAKAPPRYVLTEADVHKLRSATVPARDGRHAASRS